MNRLLHSSGGRALLLLAFCFNLFQALHAQPNVTKATGTSSTTTGAFGTSTRKFQVVYQPADLTGAQSGILSKLYFQYASGTGAQTLLDLKISMGQPSPALFSPATAFITGLTTVLSASSYTINLAGLSSGSWIEIPLQTPFAYNSTLPIVVEVSNASATGADINVLYSTGPSSPNHKKLYSTASATATTGSTSTTWQNIGFLVTPPVTDDAGIAGVTLPTMPVTPGTQPVQVSLRNWGSNTLTSAQINWSVDGVTQAPFSWTGSLPFLSTANVNIGNYNFTPGYHTITAWTSLPNGNADGNPSNDQLSTTITFCTPLSGTVQVDAAFAASNPGAGQFKNFTDLAAALSNCGISGNVTVNVAAGSGPYNEQVTFRSVPGAGAGATITINGNGEAVQYSPNNLDRFIIRLDGAQYFNFNNLGVRLGTGATYGYGYHLYNGSANNTIQNSTIDFATNTGASSASTFYAGIAVSGDPYSPTGEDALVHDVVIKNNTILGGTTMGYGVALSGDAAVKSANNQITGNTITNFKSRGIIMYYTEGNIVKGNTLTTTTGGGGMYIWTANNNITIDGNRISASGTNTSYEGLYLNQLTGNSVVKNNLIYNIKFPTLNTYGIRLVAVATGTKVYFNTVILDDQTATAGDSYAIYESSSANTGYDFKNNILYVTRTGSGNKAGLQLASTTNLSTGLSSDYNVFWVPGGTSVRRGTTAYTLSAWQTASSKDANSVEADPIFQATGEPTNLAINNIALAGTGITVDITGLTRGSSPDPGAFEFPQNAPLPVQFSYFNGQRDGQQNKLNFGTATETNNHGFDVERSADGRSFEAIGFVASKGDAGNSSDPLHYHFIDARPLSSTNYYRLRQVDLNGKFSYSGIVVIKSGPVTSLELVMAYPNPVRDQLGLIFQTPVKETLQVTVTDIGGRILQTNSRQLAAGSNNISLNTTQLASGSYVIIALSPSGRIVQRFIKH